MDAKYTIALIIACMIFIRSGIAQDTQSEAERQFLSIEKNPTCEALKDFKEKFPTDDWSILADALMEDKNCARALAPNDTQANMAPPNAAKTCRANAVTVRPKEGPQVCLTPGSGQTFRDCKRCPELVVVPPGQFKIGSPLAQAQRDTDENLAARRISRVFAVGAYEVTRGEFAHFVEATGHKASTLCAGREAAQVRPTWRSPGFSQTARDPVVCVSWRDAKSYVEWLSSETGKAYRLLSEAEWEYMARAGTQTPFWWGSEISPAQANYDTEYKYNGAGETAPRLGRTIEVGSFNSNPWGLFDVSGNVWEWVADCYTPRHAEDAAPARPNSNVRCRHTIRGGSWDSFPKALRSANRTAGMVKSRAVIGASHDIGLRVARDIEP